MGKRAVVLLSVFWMLVVVAGVSSAITLSLCGVDQANQSENGGVLTVTEKEYQTINRYSRLDEVLEILLGDYYTALDEDVLIEGAVRGMMEAVNDDYTFYYNPEEMLALAARSQGIYEGVGMLLSADENGELTVLRIFRDSPALKAGIRPGDRIVEINGLRAEISNAKDLDAAIQKIKGNDEGVVSLTIRRESDLHELQLSTDTITINRVEYAILEGDIGYINIYEFIGDDVTAFQRAVKALREANVNGLILDLRSNPGGLLTDVVEIADTLLPDGLIVYTKDRDGRREEYYSDAEYWNIDMAVLVNGMSASASEILAGALQDYGVATVVGETTYGKGIVQTVIPFRSDGAGMQLTTASYYTPKGRSIHGIGIVPDLLVEQEESFFEPDLEKDAQLKAAYDLLMRS